MKVLKNMGYFCISLEILSHILKKNTNLVNNLIFIKYIFCQLKTYTHALKAQNKIKFKY